MAYSRTMARPLQRATSSERVDYLKRVLAWTTGGLFIAGVCGSAMTLFLFVALSAGFTIFFNTIVQLGIILGCFALAQYVARGMVFGDSKIIGFIMANVCQGIAMGYLLLSAISIGSVVGNPFGLIISALMLTGLTGVGLTGYVWTSPKDFSLLGGALSAISLPMLVLMGVSFVFPSLFGGVLGTIICAVFVAVSAAALLYQINAVLHQLQTDQHVEGSYMISMGILVLFWNILSLLMHRE